jgi:hypothetical protein
LQRPAWPVSVDADPRAAETIRAETLAARAADHRLDFAPHYPFPGVGHVVSDGTAGAAFRWQP